MPWLYCFLYSILIVTNTIYIFSQTYHKHPTIVAIAMLSMYIAFAIILRIGEWYRLRQENQAHAKDE